MSSDAQKLISISLSKIAGSRTQKSFSLHKNLLVATVLQKARYAFMEETFQLMTSVHQESELLTPVDEVEPEFGYMSDFVESAAARIAAEVCDKENMCEQSVTYLDLDTNKSMNSRDVLVSTENNREQRKRRRTVSESETEEAVLSILPKRHRSESELSPENNNNNPANAMDVDHITSLVSIFSFGGRCPSDSGKLTRSMSTPDLCSTQASKDEIVNMQRPYLAMTV